MQENIDLIELEQTLQNIENLTLKVENNLRAIDNAVKDNINSNQGIWDSNAAEDYKKRWETLAEEYPKVLKTFEIQKKNLEKYINSLKKVD